MNWLHGLGNLLEQKFSEGDFMHTGFGFCFAWFWSLGSEVYAGYVGNVALQPGL